MALKMVFNKEELPKRDCPEEKILVKVLEWSKILGCPRRRAQSFLRKAGFLRMNMPPLFRATEMRRQLANALLSQERLASTADL